MCKLGLLRSKSQKFSAIDSISGNFILSLQEKTVTLNEEITLIEISFFA